MRGNLKAVGVVLVVVLAICAVGAQGALGAVEHEFHADGQKTIVTGIDTNDHEVTLGSAGVVKCTTVQGEGTQVGTEVSAGTFKTDEITVVPHYSGCTFGGNPATVNFEHCAVVLDSDTTTGNTTGGEHANVEIECEAGNSIKIATSVCTLTIGAQLIKHAVRYENDPSNTHAINLIGTAHGVIFGNLNDKGGCALMPKGAIGKYVGKATATCYKDDNETALEGTAKTTPTETTKEGSETECKVSNL